MGIGGRLWLPRRIAAVSTLLSLALGWIVLAAVGSFIALFTWPTLLLLAAGEVIYSGVRAQLVRSTSPNIAPFIWRRAMPIDL